MYKQAKFGVGDALSLMNPFASAMNADPETPMRLAQNPVVNRAIWNVLFSGGAMLAAGAGLKYLTSRVQDKHLDKKQQEAVDAKLNGIVPVTEPDSDLEDTEEREKRKKKEIPVKKKASAEQEDPSVGGTFGRMAGTALLNSLPVLAAGGALYAGSKMVSDVKKEDRTAALQKEIAELQNKLDSLYSQRLALREERRKLQKQASIFDSISDFVYGSDDPESAKRSTLIAGMELPIVSAALASALAGYGAYKYFSKRDKDRAKVKMLEKRILPTDLVGTPPTIVMETGEDGKLHIPGRGGRTVEVETESSPAVAAIPASDQTLTALGLNL